MRCRARRDAVALIALAAALIGCKKDAPEPEVDRLVIAGARAVRTGPVGVGDARAPATYALVDVTNRHDRAVVTQVTGTLIDGAGNPLGPTLPEMLTIPAGGTRMFALVDARRRVLDNASAADVQIKGASFAHAPPRLVIDGETQYRDQGRAVVSGRVENRGGGEATVLVIAAFYDAAGAPMDREAVPYRISAGQRRATQHVGPPGSARGALFVADYN